MPTPTTYHYSIQANFPFDAVAPDRLTQEIGESAIVTALSGVTTYGDDCSIIFKDPLSPGDETILDGIVAVHSGDPLPQNAAQPVEIYTAGAPSPTTSDGKQIVLPNLFPGNVYLYIHGAGDSTTVRGDGDVFVVQRDTAGESEMDWSYMDWIYLAGGGIQWNGAQAYDWLSVKVYAPASGVVANGSGTGNCNLVDPGVGAAIMIVPAAGNGAYDVDLATAVPVPAYAGESEVGTGYWNWNLPDTGMGTITPSVPAQGGYYLFAVAMDLVRFVNKLPVLGNGNVNITLPAVKPKKIFPQWKFKAILHNHSGHAGLQVTWYVTAARVKTI